MKSTVRCKPNSNLIFMINSITPTLSFLLLLNLSLHAQTDSTDIQIPPTFPGGEQALLDYLKNNFVTPAEAYRTGVEGTVTATFVIDTAGYVRDVAIVRPLHPAVDAEMTRLVQSMPRWQPGRANGNPVKVRFTLPMRVSIPHRLTGFEMDFHLNAGAGRWLGGIGKYFEIPSGVYETGILFPLKSLRVGINFVGVNAGLRDARVIRDVPFEKGQKFVFGWLGLEVQRPWTLSERFIFSPVFSVGATFQSNIVAEKGGKSKVRSWGFGLMAGAMLDWVFARHPFDKGTYKLLHSVQLRLGLLPSVSSTTLYEGAAGIATIGYGLRIGRP